MENQNIQAARRTIFTGATSAACTVLAVLAPATVLAADSAPTATATNALEEVVVTARRETERLQDVPVSVQVVTGDSLQKLAITSVDEISKLAPGLTLTNDGSNTAVVLRGVAWQPGSGTPATPIYFNEVPFDPDAVIVSMFDVSQVEVLRGPQGTRRGAPSISGAVTLTTKRPNLRETGGFVQGSFGSGKHADFQAAYNFPLIKDELAIRLATNIENSEGDRIKSVNSSVKPSYKDRSYRATLLWQPTDTLSFQGMYSQRETRLVNFTQVAGTGSPGFAGYPGVLPSIRANFNGPALNVSDRASVQEQPRIYPQSIDLFAFNANWEVAGHQLSYNFGRLFNRSPDIMNPLDPLNILPGFEGYETISTVGLPRWSTHEIRLSSLESPDRKFDYDIGWFSKDTVNKTIFKQGRPVYLTGAFGHPVTAGPGDVTTPVQNYVMNTLTDIGFGQKFESYYGNLRLRFTDQDELSVGLATVKDKVPVHIVTTTGAAAQAFTDPRLPSTDYCPYAAPGATASTIYTTGVICDFNIPAGAFNGSQHINDSFSATLYNLSLSHKFSADLLGYFTTGSSFRSGLPAMGEFGLPSNLTTPKPEKAKSYELGLKSNIGSRLRINAAIFQLDYKNQLTAFEGVNYLNAFGDEKQTGLAFYQNVNAKVRGMEIEIAAKPTDQLTLGANLSYSSIKSKGGSVPCNSSTPLTEENPMNFCASSNGEVLNTQAPFQATFSGSYEIPIGNAMSAYLRGNASYKGNNPNYGNFRTGSDFKKTPAYTVVDLFVGITGQKGSWDLGLYAKNAFDKQVELARVAAINEVYENFAAPAGYDVVRTSAPREIGVKLYYAFGKR